MRYVYYCTGCGYLGTVEGEDKSRICPTCGKNLTPTHITKEDWVGKTGEEKAALKEAWKNAENAKTELQRRKNELVNSKDGRRFSGEFYGIPDLIYRIEGARGRSIDIYPYKCVISTDVTLGSLITNNATDGEKTIYYQDVIGLQIKTPGLTLGYIQFETAAATQNNSSSNFFNENTFTYDSKNISDEEMASVIRYIKSQLDSIKEAQRRAWMK